MNQGGTITGWGIILIHPSERIKDMSFMVTARMDYVWRELDIHGRLPHNINPDHVRHTFDGHVMTSERLKLQHYGIMGDAELGVVSKADADLAMATARVAAV